MTLGPDPDRWSDMKARAMRDLFRQLGADGVYDPKVPMPVSEPKSDATLERELFYLARTREEYERGKARDEDSPSRSRVEPEVLRQPQSNQSGYRGLSEGYVENLKQWDRLLKNAFGINGYYSGGSLQSDYQDICPRCGQDRNRVRHCDPRNGFRREGFVPEPEPVRLSFGDDEVIDGEVLAVDQPELEQ